jgi:hypothetical protein
MADRKMITPEDIARQERVARALEKAWGITLVRDPNDMAQINYTVRTDREVVGYVLIKTRKNAHDRFPELGINRNKYRALMRQRGGGLPVIWATGFTDDVILWIRAEDIDPTFSQMRGRSDREGVSTDVEPMIDVPISEMKSVLLR